MRIHRLPALIANQIAAGEVIEKPASVVKELLENSSDAGSQAIQIDIGFGGLNQIKVSDNGRGIIADDLKLAIAAHATSKITQLEDLYQLSSFGFRGEALASISAISRLTISSKASDQIHAMMLKVDETGMSLHPCARNQGTTVDVQDLFYNAPVRKKFLKSERAEFQAIEGVIRQFALSDYRTKITLRHNNKLVLSLPEARCDTTRLGRIKKLLGNEFVKQATYIDIERGGMHLYGWVGDKNYQRSQRDKQWFYINQRSVKDKLLSHAVQQSYQPWLHPGRFPACLLYLIMPASEVDVNVHPTKQEVRFQDPRSIHDLIVSSISPILATKPVSLLCGVPQTLPFMSTDEMTTDLLITPLFSGGGRLGLGPPLNFTDLRASSSDGHLIRYEPRKDPQPQAFSWLTLNAQFAVIFLNEYEPYLVDLIRLHEDYCQNLLASQPRPIPNRPLLVPITYEIDRTSYELFEQYKQILPELGIQFDFLSVSKLLIRTIPLCLPHLDITLFIKNIDENFLDQEMILKQLTICQSFNPLQSLDEERGALASYLQQIKFIPPYCVSLDAPRCLSMMPYG